MTFPGGTVLGSILGGMLYVMAAYVAAEPLPPPGTIGLLELPQLFGTAPCQEAGSEPLPFYPDAAVGEALGEIQVDQMAKVLPDGGCQNVEVAVHWFDESRVRLMTTEEFAYERRGAVVTEQAGEWFKILLAERVAWIKPRSDARFHPLSGLYKTQATYLSNSWDGRICSRPGHCRMTSISPDSAPGVEVIESRIARGKRWFKIVFLARGACGEADEEVPNSLGWVPAYGSDDKPIIWFYSRGC